MDPSYGRNRQSVENINEMVYKLLEDQPDAKTHPDGTVTVPSTRIRDFFWLFEGEDKKSVLSEEEENTLMALIEDNPGMEISAEVLMPMVLVAEERRGKGSVNPDAGGSESPSRGRTEVRSDEEYSGERSSSSDSTGTRRHPSRPPSRSGSSSAVPQTPRAPSALDSSRRQRATPLSSQPPSSYAKRPVAPARRKSDAGNRSDGESYSTGPSTWGYRNAAPGRSRAPSNPTSPHMGDFSELLGSPTFKTPSRPGSRNQGFFRGSPTDGYSSPDDTLYSPNAFTHSISSLPMPRHSDDSDEDDDESGLGLVMEREHTASTVSMEPIDRMELLQQANAELSRKLADAEKTLLKRLNEHEAELEELTMKIDELNTELHATKKEEKELRSKERTNITQISTLESEIARLSKQVETARTSYQSLQRQYQEQCSASEKYRDDLRQRDETLRTYMDAAQSHEHEQNKWGRERSSYEARIANMETELQTALAAAAELEVQKQENLMLKETIDRMRYEMDELRNSLTNNVGGPGSGASSRNNTVSKSLGAELAGKLAEWDGDGSDQEETDDDGEGGSETVVETSDGDDEEVIHTMIRRRRKVPSKANQIQTHHTFEETKEYSDSSTQYDAGMFLVASSIQTDPEPSPPPRIIMATQTDPPPEKHSIEIGTDPIEEEQPAERTLVEIEIQTDELPEASTSASASTSESITPKSAHIALPADSPPTYDQVAYEREVQSRVAAELRKLHRGNGSFSERVVNEGILEEWQAFKEELGLECSVIDEALEKATIVPRPREEQEADKKRGFLGGRFYRNIYNTYVYGGGGASEGESSTSSRVTQGAIIAGASALVIGASALVQIALANSGYGQVYNLGIPGGPTYQDRVAWAGFNAMPGAAEGFAYYGGGHHGGDGALWTFLGRAAEGAARVAAGWPT